MHMVSIAGTQGTCTTSGACIAPSSAVDHPRHYNESPSGIECIDVVRHMNFNVGNSMKYLWRAGHKSGSSTTEDLEKARWYITNELERLSGSSAGLMCTRCGMPIDGSMVMIGDGDGSGRKFRHKECT